MAVAKFVVRQPCDRSRAYPSSLGLTEVTKEIWLCHCYKCSCKSLIETIDLIQTCSFSNQHETVSSRDSARNFPSCTLIRVMRKFSISKQTIFKSNYAQVFPGVPTWIHQMFLFEQERRKHGKISSSSYTLIVFLTSSPTQQCQGGEIGGAPVEDWLEVLWLRLWYHEMSCKSNIALFLSLLNSINGEIEVRWSYFWGGNSYWKLSGRAARRKVMFARRYKGRVLSDGCKCLWLKWFMAQCYPCTTV